MRLPFLLLVINPTAATTSSSRSMSSYTVLTSISFSYLGQKSGPSLSGFEVKSFEGLGFRVWGLGFRV